MTCRAGAAVVVVVMSISIALSQILRMIASIDLACSDTSHYRILSHLMTFWDGMLI
jgi:hypothetical protein